MSRPQRKRSRANTAGEDVDAAISTKKVWTAMEPPPIVCFSHEALIKWEMERKLYEAAATSRESLTAVVMPVINTIHRCLLRTFCELELKVKGSEMTNETLVNATSQILSSMLNDQIPNVHVIMNQHLKMDIKQKDVKARILNYIDRFEEIVEEYGLSIALDANDKLKCRLLANNLRPTSLKEQVQLYQDLGPTVKINFDVIKTEALKKIQSFDLFQANRDRATSKPLAKAYRPNIDKVQCGDRTQPLRAERRDDKSTTRKNIKAPAQGCIHCKGKHWVNECPTATEEQKRDARRAFIEKRQGSESSTMKRFVQRDEELEPKHVAFNGVVTMPYHPDNDTKYNVIPRHVVDETHQVCPEVKIRRLEKAILGKAVGGAIIRCSGSIKLDLELLTPAGKVRMRNVTCIITETNEYEFRLGSMTIKALGIDVDEQLVALANREIVDFDPVQSTIPNSFDSPDKKKNTARLKRNLFQVVTCYDTWRIAISNDPPSKIEPFVIRFKGGTEPIRCKPRTYALAEREWMKAFNEWLVSLGWVYRNEASRWSSPARPVKMPGKSGGLRQAVDLRRRNAQTTHDYPPHLIQGDDGGWRDRKTGFGSHPMQKCS
ncbi:hypothetical protein PHPALM_32134 [Phytophthora palmivora]|uniref:Uncharacterized protein n=1 Tax=Phytophthora palmivora TaxID=4796 RepID=A0A2P4X0U4_9STRA|nr:hypothetical protein PHPALM_32134 [Phytophthora palmivora]